MKNTFLITHLKFSNNVIIIVIFFCILMLYKLGIIIIIGLKTIIFNYYLQINYQQIFNYNL